MFMMRIHPLRDCIRQINNLLLRLYDALLFSASCNDGDSTSERCPDETHPPIADAMNEAFQQHVSELEHGETLPPCLRAALLMLKSNADQQVTDRVVDLNNLHSQSDLVVIIQYLRLLSLDLIAVCDLPSFPLIKSSLPKKQRTIDNVARSRREMDVKDWKRKQPPSTSPIDGAQLDASCRSATGTTTPVQPSEAQRSRQNMGASSAKRMKLASKTSIVALSPTIGKTPTPSHSSGRRG